VDSLRGMAHITCRFFSEVLRVAVSVEVVLPEAASSAHIGMGPAPVRKTYPVLYLLHGLSDDETIWLRRTAVERYAEPLGLALVCPAVGRSFYQDMACGGKYWTYVSEELPRRCAEFFPLSAAREETFACGFSMGGYGAFRLGLACPERFGAVASLSGVLVLEERAGVRARQPLLAAEEQTGIFGGVKELAGTEADLRHLATLQAAAPGPRARMLQVCGREDFLLPDNRMFRDHLAPLGLDWSYEESEGAHDWAYVDRAVQRVLEWLG